MDYWRKLTQWWERLPGWARIVLSFFSMFMMGAFSSYYSNYIVPPFQSFLYAMVCWFFEVFGVPGIAILIAIGVTTLYQAKKFNYVLEELRESRNILRVVASKLNVELREPVNSPGYVYTDCGWLRISREEVKNGKHHIYVYCAHSKAPMGPEGCPYNCPYYDPAPPQPTGSGAFAGMVLGGLLGMVLGGPPGVVLGGLLGAVIGNALEVYRPVRERIAELKRRGVPYAIHIDIERIRRARQ